MKNSASIDEKELKRLGCSSDPNDWLLAWEYHCSLTAQGKFPVINLYQGLVMLGVGPDDPIDCIVRDDKWPWDFDQQAHEAITKNNLLQSLRSVVFDDLRSTNSDPRFSEYGEVALWAYARWLINHFLVTDPAFDSDDYFKWPGGSNGA